MASSPCPPSTATGLPSSASKKGSEASRRRWRGSALGVSSRESWRMEPLFPESTVSEASCSTATRPSRMSVASSRSRELSSNSRSRVAASCRFTGRTRMASSVREAQRLVSSVVSWRYRNMASSWPSNFFCRAGFMEAKPSRMASSEAYSWNSFSAVFGPTPRTPGMLSLESPMIACTSGHCVGLRPVSSSKLLRVTIFSSLLAGSHIMTLSCRHCLRSLSVATRITGRSSR